MAGNSKRPATNCSVMGQQRPRVNQRAEYFFDLTTNLRICVLPIGPIRSILNGDTQSVFSRTLIFRGVTTDRQRRREEEKTPRLVPEKLIEHNAPPSRSSSASATYPAISIRSGTPSRSESRSSASLTLVANLSPSVFGLWELFEPVRFLSA